jgi:hypothetical protein
MFIYLLIHNCDSDICPDVAGANGSEVVKAQRYKPEVRGFEIR